MVKERIEMAITRFDKFCSKLWQKKFLQEKHAFNIIASFFVDNFYRTRVRSLATLADVVTVADVDAEKCVNDSLVQIWKLKFGLKVKFLFRL